MSGIFWSEPPPPPPPPPSTDFGTMLFYLFIGWILIKMIEGLSDGDNNSRQKKKKNNKKNKNAEEKSILDAVVGL